MIFYEFDGRIRELVAGTRKERKNVRGTCLEYLEIKVKYLKIETAQTVRKLNRKLN